MNLTTKQLATFIVLANCMVDECQFKAHELSETTGFSIDECNEMLKTMSILPTTYSIPQVMKVLNSDSFNLVKEVE